jgi:hypothetical protein
LNLREQEAVMWQEEIVMEKECQRLLKVRLYRVKTNCTL